MYFIQVYKNFGCQTNVSTVDIGVQTEVTCNVLRYRSPSVEINTSDEPSDNMDKDPDWIPDLQSDDDGVHSRQENLPENKERKVIVFESQLDLLLCRECIYCGLNNIARKQLLALVLWFT